MMYDPSPYSSPFPGSVCKQNADLDDCSYDAFKIFMGLPTTGGPIDEQKKKK